jgi:double zinc ribbon protein
MGPIALFGIENSGLALAVNLLLLFLVVIWLALVYWTYADAHRRIADPMLVACATAASLFPFIGTIVYLIVRPPEYLDDVRERELEMAAIEEQLAERDLRCPVCRGAVDPSYLVCPVCTTRLKQACEECGSPLEPIWQVCPYCATPVPPGIVTGEEVLQPVRQRRSRRAD